MKSDLNFVLLLIYPSMALNPDHSDNKTENAIFTPTLPARHISQKMLC